jgi:hypothetical protein
VRLAAALAALCLAACGYSTGIRAASRGTVGVEFFGNRSLERDLERPLADEIARVLRDVSDAPLVDPRRADLVVRGTILEFRRRSGVRSTDNQLLETGLRVHVEAELYDARLGAVVAGPLRQDVWVGYTLDQTANEREARDRALRNVAEEVVLDLFSTLD